MAFGDLLDTGSVSTSNITNPFVVDSAAGLSVSVAVGDLVVGVISEILGLTATAVTDNLSNTYVASNAGSTSGNTNGRMFYSRVTNAGTLNTVNFAATASTHDASAVVAVFAGPFVVSPVDKNPANETTDITTPHACPVTGTLAQEQELVVSWGAVQGASNSVNGVGTGTLAVRNAALPAAASLISYTVTVATTSIAHTYTSGLNPTTVVFGTTSFKATLGQPTVKRFGGIPFMSPIGRGVW